MKFKLKIGFQNTIKKISFLYFIKNILNVKKISSC